MKEDGDVIVEQKSKSQVKRELKALQELGKELVEMPAASLARVPLPDTVRGAVDEARGLRREALRRQLHRVGKLLRETDEAQIRQAIAQVSQPQREEKKAFHEVEQWRDRLILGDEALLQELVVRFPVAERQHLRQLARNATKERELNKPPKSARQLFRYLSQLRADDPDKSA